MFNREQLGELSAILVGPRDAERVVVMLHGREMHGEDLAPFAQTLADQTLWVFPDATLESTRAKTWWPVDSEARLRGLAAGPMELSQMDPPGRAEARIQLAAFLTALAPKKLLLAGFSQGGMLAMDSVLHGGRRPDALVLLSSTRIAIADWQPRAHVLEGLRVLVAHGDADAELSLYAGEQLYEFAKAAGANATWLPFEGGHQLPFVVWRALKKLVKDL